eukprot:COSAG01_NODE_70414_length_258_cov_1.415094_1_plen_48_part_01
MTEDHQGACLDSSCVCIDLGYTRGYISSCISESALSVYMYARRPPTCG